MIWGKVKGQNGAANGFLLSARYFDGSFFEAKNAF